MFYVCVVLVTVYSLLLHRLLSPVLWEIYRVNIIIFTFQMKALRLRIMIQALLSIYYRQNITQVVCVLVLKKTNMWQVTKYIHSTGEETRNHDSNKLNSLLLLEQAVFSNTVYLIPVLQDLR